MGASLVATGATVLTNPAFGSTGQSGAVTIATTGPASISDSIIDTHSDVGTGSGGAISMSASDLTLQNTTIMTGVFGDGITPGTGSGGAVTLMATNGTLSLTDSTVSTSAFFAAGGGAVDLTGTENVILTRSNIHTESFLPLSPGDSGALNIAAPVISLEDSFISTQVSGDGITPITTNGGAVTLTGTTSVSLLHSTISTDSFETEGNSGAVTIIAPTVTMVEDPFTPSAGITTGTHNFSDPNAGNGGDIVITATQTNVTFTGAHLESIAEGPGTSSRKGGDIRISGAQRILLDDGTSFLSSANSQGNAGNIELVSPHVTISEQSTLASSTFSTGSAGTITIISAGNIALESGSTIFTSAEGGSQGPGGHIGISTPQLAVTGGSRLRSESLVSGPGGTVSVHGINSPAQSVLIDGSGSGISTTTRDNGTGGSINISAQSLTVQNGGTLTAATSGTDSSATGGVITVNANTITLTTGGTMTAASTGAGAAGDITVQGLASPANSVLIDGSGSGIFTNTSSTGAGGNIVVNGNSVALQNGSHISSSSTGTGIAGDVTINAGNQFAMSHSSVTTEANQSSGGAIKITTNSDATVQLTNSTISASVLDGTGGGGSVNIDPQYVILQNSQILANAVFGAGGNIFITTNLLLPDTLSLISASSRFGQQGTITIQSPISPASGKIVPLGQKPLIATALLSQRCAALAGGNISSFTVAGRDSLPAEPGGWLSSPLALAPAELVGSIGTEPETRTSLSGSTEEMPVVSLRRIAPPGFLTQSFAADWTTGCTS